MNASMRRRYAIFLLFLAAFMTGGSSNKVTIGRVERIQLPQYALTLKGRVDTGAHTSSLHAINPKVIKVDNVRYIEFDTQDFQGKRFHIRTKLYRESAIKSTAGEADVRYVIREEVQLGNRVKEININLSDRSHLKYNFLIGRDLLRGDFVVDVSQSHMLGD